MKYLKKFQFINESNESKEDNLSKYFKIIGLDKWSVLEIFSDLSDIGYSIESKFSKRDKGGKHIVSTLGYTEYLPCIIINVTRSDDNLGYDSESLNWDGGIYYDNSEDLLDSIYHSMSTLKSMIAGKAKLYWTVRNLNDISIRILFDKVDTGGIDFGPIREILKNDVFSIDRISIPMHEQHIIEDYQIIKTGSGYLEFMIINRPPNNGENSLIIGGERFSSKAIKNIANHIGITYNNLRSIEYISKNLINEVVNRINKKTNYHLQLDIINNQIKLADGTPIIQFYFEDRKLTTLEVTLSKGLFKNKTKKLELYYRLVEFNFIN